MALLMYCSMSFYAGPTSRNNYTYFECIPSACDNPFDRYGLEHVFYEEVTSANAFHPSNARCGPPLYCSTFSLPVD